MFADIEAENAKISTSNNNWPDFSDISDNELIQTCEKIESNACKEENNLDYQPFYEDVLDNEDLPTGRFGSPVSDKEVADASRKRYAI